MSPHLQHKVLESRSAALEVGAVVARKNVRVVIGRVFKTTRECCLHPGVGI